MDKPDFDVAPIGRNQAEFEATLDADGSDRHLVPAGPVLEEMRATAERIRRERRLRETTAA